MKRTLILLLAISLLSYANDSRIQIDNVQGGANFGSGTINNNHFDAKLKIVEKNSYSKTVNITTVIKQDKKLLNEFKKQFGSIQANYIKLESLNYAQKRVLKIIEAKLLKQGQLLTRQKQVLDNLLGTVQQLNITTNYISEVTTDTNLMVGNIQVTTQQTLQVVQELNNKINKPEIIIDINWHNSDFCKDLNLRKINQIVIHPEALFNYNYNQNGITHLKEEGKLKCLKTLFNPYQNQEYKIKLYGKNQKTVDKVIDKIVQLSKIDDSKLSSNYQPSTNVVRFELIRLSY